jgi:hypothetical protein
MQELEHSEWTRRDRDTPQPQQDPWAPRPLHNTSGLAPAVSKTTWSPVEALLTTRWVLAQDAWKGVTGSGKISYFELDKAVVPRWFGVLVPNGVTSFDKVHIFFHPTPSQAGYKDPDYQGLGKWSNIFHYLSDDFGSQFCAAGTGRVLVMPLMTTSVAGSCGIFPQRWETIVGSMLGMLKAGDMSGSAPAVSITNVVVSSFSSGITYSHHFRGTAKLGGRLAGVIDLNGEVSSFGQYSAMIARPPGRIVKVTQTAATQRQLPALATQNIFPLPHSRWSGPYADVFSKNERIAMLQIHGTIPQTMMFIASQRAG